jgi:hypothetical protein
MTSGIEPETYGVPTGSCDVYILAVAYRLVRWRGARA